MKKLSLSVQITLVFLIAFIITSILLSIFILGMLDAIYTKSVFDILEAEGKALKLSTDLSNFKSADGLAFIDYKSNDKTYRTSDNIYDYMDESSIKLLINKAAIQDETTIRHINIINDKAIYYVVIKYSGFFDIQGEDIFIVLTDSSIKNSMIKTSALQILVASIIAFILGYMIILIWISKLVKDTKNITNSLAEIGESNYTRSIITKRQDEIGALVNSIEIMRKKIIENEKIKQEIIQGVSHDLKTPIAIIQSYSEALNDEMCSPKEAVEIIDKQCNRLNKKVSELLNLTRINYMSMQEKSTQFVSIDEVIGELYSMYRYQSDIIIELSLNEVQFLGDKESWIIAIDNILSNALRYAKTKIIIGLKDEIITIFNDGKNIEESQLDGIFNAFEKSSDGKFGLGLSITKRITELYSYTIDVKNLHDGVCFTIKKS